MQVYKTVLLQDGVFVSSIMNRRTFADPWLQKVYTLNTTTYYDEPGFPLYAWNSEREARKSVQRFTDQYILQCEAESYFHDFTYLVSSNHALQNLKDPVLRITYNTPIQEMTYMINGSLYVCKTPVVLCAAITPISCIG